MKFSIIVPVFNVENYLKECINSLLNQTFDDYEIILVDDGSTDKSGILCDDYAEKFDKIKVFHKKNGGLSEARNYGIDNAKGEYLIFVDSDDWIDINSLYEFNSVIKERNIDVIETRLIEAYEDRLKYCDSKLEEYVKTKKVNKKSIVKWILEKSQNTWPAQKRIYSSEFIHKYNLRFLKDRLHEDLDWTSNVIYLAERYDVCTYPWYYHRMKRNGSITNSVKAKNITDVIEMASIHYKRYMEDKTEIRKKVMYRIMKSVYGKLNQIKKCSIDDREKVINCINNNKEIFSIKPKFKYKIFVLIMQILGTENAITILDIF